MLPQRVKQHAVSLLSTSGAIACRTPQHTGPAGSVNSRASTILLKGDRQALAAEYWFPVRCRQRQWIWAACGNKRTPVAVQVQPCQAGLVSSLQSAHPLTWVAVLLLAFVVKKTLDTPSRTYDPNNPNVGHEYDVWTE